MGLFLLHIADAQTVDGRTLGGFKVIENNQVFAILSNTTPPM